MLELARHNNSENEMGIKKRGRTAEEALAELKATHGTLEFNELAGPVSTRDKIEAVCKTHGTFVKEFRKLVGAGASGCPTCNKEAAGRIVPFKTYVERANKIHGEYTYLPDGYTGTNGDITLVCKEHGKVVASATSHLAGAKCRYCAKARLAEASKVTEKEFFDRCREGHGNKYSYIEGSYTGLTEKVRIVCQDHGEFEQVASYHLYSLAGCRMCASLATRQKNTVPFAEFVARSRETHGDRYEYGENTYEGIASKAVVVCKEHGEFEQLAVDHSTRYGCSKCAGAVSKGETELYEYVQGLGVELDGSFRYNGRREFDILVSKHNLAVEYDGLMWHSTKYRTMEEQLRKRVDAENLGVNLVRIFEHEWLLKRKQVESLLSARLGLAKSTVFARKCVVLPVTNDEAKDFHDANHIQGWKRAGLSYGLSLDDALVAVMTFTETLSSRKTEEGVHELIRYSSSKRVIGGAGKLLKHYVNTHSPDKVVSYSDKRLFSGKLYESLGFVKVHDVAPSYSYWKAGTLELKHKSGFRREKLVSILGDKFDAEKTEKQNCEENGYYQVYDDGKIRWELEP